jgi:hypothetical protein
MRKHVVFGMDKPYRNIYMNDNYIKNTVINMKRRIIIGSILIIFLLSLVPATNAIQIQTIKKESSTLFFSFDTMKNMDSAALVVFIRTLAKDYPELFNVFQQKVKEIEETPSSTVMEQLGMISHHSSQGPQPAADNQTFLEKIYWKIFNYRVFRLYISTCIFLYHPSKLTLMRTMTWGIKLLRLVKIGIILGFINPTPQQPQPPTIVFGQDLVNKTLTVTAVTPDKILWSDIDQIGSGSCDPLPNGNVTVGDQITNCTGIIVLRYVPLNEIIGVFEF